MSSALLAIIGGTGVYGVQGMEAIEELNIDTPFGPTSSKIIIGKVENTTVAFLARHDVGHRLLPTEIPFRANIWALKSIGVKYMLSFGACGSLKEEAKPLDVVLVDQFIDRTNTREQTFFGEGIIAHVALGDPVCHILKDIVKTALEGIHGDSDSKTHDGGTYVCIEGPAFSTRAESMMYRQWGGSVIGMTAVPEYKLAREAEIAYTCVAFITDFDCWHPDHENVTVELVLSNLKKNGDMAQLIVKKVVTALELNGDFESKAHSALQYAILTHKEHISPSTREKLRPIIGKYVY
jgi:5'-methylthioadenosine phosphorylase